MPGWLIAAIVMLFMAFCGLISETSADPPAPPGSPEDRAIAFLAREVPRWPRENQCFSCHNNGDAARALFAAKKHGVEFPSEALGDTTEWLSHPRRWEHNGGAPEFNDKQLATIQFAFAFAEAVRLKQIDDRQPLIEAARKLAPYQKPDGSWQPLAAGTLGSPITYGNVLATTIARQTLITADRDGFKEEITRAEAWLKQQVPRTVLGSAALLLAFPEAGDASTRTLRRRSLAIIGDGQHSSGGWGPYVNARPEPFDTAIVLLALWGLADDHEISEQVARGRRYLIANQQADGSWLETTRPAGDESYAHRISTTGWATLALLATHETSDEMSQGPR